MVGNGWNTILSYWVSAYFQGLKPVSFRVYVCQLMVSTFQPLFFQILGPKIASNRVIFPRGESSRKIFETTDVLIETQGGNRNRSLTWLAVLMKGFYDYPASSVQIAPFRSHQLDQVLCWFGCGFNHGNLRVRPPNASPPQGNLALLGSL